MHENPLCDFISSFDESYHVSVSDEELQEKFDRMNQWFQTLKEEEILEKAYEVQACLKKAIAYAEEQKSGLGEQLQANKRRVKANRLYSKF